MEFNDGGVWREIPGIIDYNESGGEAPRRDVVPAKGGVAARLGRNRVQQVACQAFEVPTHAAWDKMYEAWANSTVLAFRFTTAEQILYDEAADSPDDDVSMAIAANTGVVTFTGGNNAIFPRIGNNSLGPGAALVNSGATKAYRVEDAGADAGAGKAAKATGMVVNPAPGGAVAAATGFKIVIPATQRGPFRAKVASVDLWTIAAEGELQSPLMLQPLNVLPKGVIVVGEKTVMQRNTVLAAT